MGRIVWSIEFLKKVLKSFLASITMMIERDVLVLMLVRTGTHGELLEK